MHNVLNVYTKKLRYNISSKDQKISNKESVDRIDFTSEGKRRATIEKVSKEILDKIIRFGSQTDPPLGRSEPIEASADNERPSTQTNSVGFVFNVIDTINKKTTNTVPVEDSSFLIQRFEQLSKDEIKTIQKTEFEDQGEVGNQI